MRTAWPLLLCLVPFLAHCKHPKEEQKLSEAVVPESFAIRCSRTDPSSELGLTYRALIESVQAENCQAAALKLQGISFLVLNEKNIKDLSPLSEFEQLQWLHLYGNRIEDISPLRKLVKLKDLVLDNNQVSDLSPIKGLSNLQELYLGRNKLTKIDALEALKKI
ncbi:MAG: leucine-rich repeat domain-containing protein [Proteobacteria bacterium]|nr:leucine-rich repeat domain-containing protein [Pseudomonadota bacterium]